ncbi:MAG TPA: type II toxin-antitoxin system Phd/YefM family antitoxin [Candidatus Dormibacteraeota bacterium]|nr:type II toxin-antitoxin system Phd/YefM family antitoxin [Candidatus Dormibacteraeota bacterium]
MKEISYIDLQKNLASVLQRVASDHESVTVRRKGNRAVVLIPADELVGLIETLYLLQSPKNAQRLLVALSRVKRTLKSS